MRGVILDDFVDVWTPLSRIIIAWSPKIGILVHILRWFCGGNTWRHLVSRPKPNLLLQICVTKTKCGPLRRHRSQVISLFLLLFMHTSSNGSREISSRRNSRRLFVGLILTTADKCRYRRFSPSNSHIWLIHFLFAFFDQLHSVSKFFLTPQKGSSNGFSLRIAPLFHKLLLLFGVEGVVRIRHKTFLQKLLDTLIVVHLVHGAQFCDYLRKVARVCLSSSATAPHFSSQLFTIVDNICGLILPIICVSCKIVSTLRRRYTFYSSSSSSLSLSCSS